jgi:hypothetical protein
LSTGALSLLKISTGPREAGDFYGPAVPPAELPEDDVDEDACENSWNSLLIWSGVMPMPLSATASLI